MTHGPLLTGTCDRTGARGRRGAVWQRGTCGFRMIQMKLSTNGDVWNHVDARSRVYMNYTLEAQKYSSYDIVHR